MIFTPHIRQHRPWRYRVKQWKDEAGNVVDLATYNTWELVAATTPPLSAAGVLDGPTVLFSLTAVETAALGATSRSVAYAVKATPAAGEVVWVVEGRLRVERSLI